MGMVSDGQGCARAKPQSWGVAKPQDSGWVSASERGGWGPAGDLCILCRSSTESTCSPVP